MPITAWLCPQCNRTVPLDHFETSACGLSLCHPDFAAAVLADRAAQPAGIIRVTQGTGCPRAAAIMESEPVAVNPLEMNAQLTGTAFHALMARSSIGQAEVEVSGVIEGIPLVGHVDSIRRPGQIAHCEPEVTVSEAGGSVRTSERPSHPGGSLVIEDHKHGGDFSRKYAELKPEYMVQLSIYGELYTQTFGERPARGIIWRHFTSSPPFVVFDFALWSAERALDHRPYDGDFTVRELYGQMQRFLGERCVDCDGSGEVVRYIKLKCETCNSTGRVNRTAWRELPLAGNSMRFGSRSFCEYCSVRHVCMEAASGAPW